MMAEINNPKPKTGLDHDSIGVVLNVWLFDHKKPDDLKRELQLKSNNSLQEDTYFSGAAVRYIGGRQEEFILIS
jgi:hypothetical protein